MNQKAINLMNREYLATHGADLKTDEQQLEILLNERRDLLDFAANIKAERAGKSSAKKPGKKALLEEIKALKSKNPERFRGLLSTKLTVTNRHQLKDLSKSELESFKARLLN
jgi:hypothetical protein